MPVYHISYDLNKSGQNYDGLYDAIKSMGAWYHFMDSSWFVDTNKSVSAIRATLMESMDKNDYLFVCKVTSENDGWLPEDVWEWLRARVN